MQEEKNMKKINNMHLNCHYGLTKPYFSPLKLLRLPI